MATYYTAPCVIPLVMIPMRRRFVKLSCPPPDVRHVTFYNEDIEVIVAKKAIHVDYWISKIWRIYGNSPMDRFTVGLDTEWRPNLAPGEDHPIAIIQLCIGQHCLIFQLLHADYIPRSLHAFLADPRFCFCGVGIKDDVDKLYSHYSLGVVPIRVADLDDLYKAKFEIDNYRCIGLKRMALKVLGKEMAKPKNVTLSAWDAVDLDADQIEYAAIDAFVSSQLALALIN